MKNRIKEFRLERGLSLAKLEEETGISAQQLNRLEKGERRLNQSNMVVIAAALKIAPEELIMSAAQSNKKQIYAADEDLMMRAADAVQQAIKNGKKKITLQDASKCTVRLYNHVMEYRKKGEIIEPSEAMATLILKSSII